MPRAPSLTLTLATARRRMIRGHPLRNMRLSRDPQVGRRGLLDAGIVVLV